MTLIAPHIAAFLQQRLPVERRASPNTCDSYAHAFKLLFQYASECLKVRPSELNLEQIDAPLVVNFLGHLETARGNGAGSRNIRLAAIKSFMHFLEYRVPSALEQIQRILAIPAKKTDTRLVRLLTADEMQSILDAPDPTVRDGIRDRAMLHLCFAGGLRVSELVGLRTEDFLLQPQSSVLVHGKGRKERCLPLWKETASALRAWLAVRGTSRAPELFLNARSTSMTRAGFEYILRKHVCAAAKRCPSLSAKRVSPHVLRHTCALTILQATKDLRKVSLWLGHSSMQTTEIYTRADPSVKLEALESVTGIGHCAEAANWALQGNGSVDRHAECHFGYAKREGLNLIEHGRIGVRTQHKTGLRIKPTGGRLGQTARRCGRSQRHARPPAAPRTRAEMRSAELAHQNRLASSGGGRVEQTGPGPATSVGRF
jgi:integrase/recombinase XerD